MDVNQVGSGSLHSSSNSVDLQAAASPDKTSLGTEVEVESYIKGMEVDALNKAKAYFDKRSGLERAANEFEERARGGCQKQVAHGKAEITSEAI